MTKKYPDNYELHVDGLRVSFATFPLECMYCKASVKKGDNGKPLPPLFPRNIEYECGGYYELGGHNGVSGYYFGNCPVTN